MMKKTKVVLGMSGGVDSSVAAALLKREGYEVLGLFMKNWEDDDDSEYCSTREDWIDAVSVADVLDIDIEAVNFAAEYRERVFAEFLREYQAGRTPNPDVLCNAEIKFKAFLDHALALGADLIATGHYAKVRQNGGRFELLKAADATKDQSYFLHRLNQAQLSKTLFPLGALEKTEVRRIADSLKLPNARKKDSTGICFIGERPFREFLNRYLKYEAGPIKTDDGKTVGRHVGLSFYTLGQRKGIGIGGLKAYRNDDGTAAAWYVARKEVESNTLYIVQGHAHPWLLSAALEAGQASWVAGTAPSALSALSLPSPSLPSPSPLPPPAHPAPSGCLPLTAKTRYRQADVACQFQPLDGGRFRLGFAAPQWAVTPGQSAVLYQGEVCLGGGIIDAMSAMPGTGAIPLPPAPAAGA